MKNLSLLFALFAMVWVSAQEKPMYIEVDYVLRMESDAEAILQQVPERFRAQAAELVRTELAQGVTLDYKLKTNGKESYYKLQERIDNSQRSNVIASQIAQSDKGGLFKDFTASTYKKEYEVMGQNYLVVDNLEALNWSISRETENIAGFETRKATGVMSDSIQIESWFAPKLSIKDGPDRFWGLPGLILKSVFEVRGMKMSVTAVNVQVREEDIKVTAPTKGKQMTMKEFEAEMEAVQERFRKMYEGGVDRD
ncbi:MAG: GLPGLI family protein [Weeksellaceae bacterium]|nr:GLPGLI family protein [Weeksellaceae bacterium]